MRWLYVTYPIWAPVMILCRGEVRLAVLALIYSPILFVAGLVLHGSCVVWNLWERVK